MTSRRHVRAVMTTLHRTRSSTGHLSCRRGLLRTWELLRKPRFISEHRRDLHPRHASCDNVPAGDRVHSIPVFSRQVSSPPALKTDVITTITRPLSSSRRNVLSRIFNTRRRIENNCSISECDASPTDSVFSQIVPDASRPRYVSESASDSVNMSVMFVSFSSEKIPEASLPRSLSEPTIPTQMEDVHTVTLHGVNLHHQAITSHTDGLTDSNAWNSETISPNVVLEEDSNNQSLELSNTVQPNTTKIFGDRTVSYRLEERDDGAKDVSSVLSENNTKLQRSSRRRKAEMFFMVTWPILFPIYGLYELLRQPATCERDVERDLVLAGWCRVVKNTKRRLAIMKRS